MTQFKLMSGYEIARMKQKDHRVKLPDEFRRAVFSNSQSPHIVLRLSEARPCIEAHDMGVEIWLTERSGHHPSLRMQFALSRKVEVGMDDRIAIPAFMREAVKLDDHIVFLGTGYGFEIWNPQMLVQDKDTGPVLRNMLAHYGASTAAIKDPPKDVSSIAMACEMSPEKSDDRLGVPAELDALTASLSARDALIREQARIQEQAGDGHFFFNKENEAAAEANIAQNALILPEMEAAPQDSNEAQETEEDSSDNSYSTEHQERLQRLLDSLRNTAVKESTSADIEEEFGGNKERNISGAGLTYQRWKFSLTQRWKPIRFTTSAIAMKGFEWIIVVEQGLNKDRGHYNIVPMWRWADQNTSGDIRRSFPADWQEMDKWPWYDARDRKTLGLPHELQQFFRVHRADIMRHAAAKGWLTDIGAQLPWSTAEQAVIDAPANDDKAAAKAEATLEAIRQKRRSTIAHKDVWAKKAVTPAQPSEPWEFDPTAHLTIKEPEEGRLLS